MLGLNDDVNNDIIDYTDSDEDSTSFVKIDRRSWNKIAYWKDMLKLALINPPKQVFGLSKALLRLINKKPYVAGV